jgi:hypothetical protein
MIMECGDRENSKSAKIHKRLRVYVYVCRPVYVHLYIRMCLFMYVRVYVRMYDVSMCKCILPVCIRVLFFFF